MATSGGVQSGGSVSGTLVIAPSGTGVAADTATTVTCDGNPVTVPCDVAAPPTWLDSSSNIIAAGLYQVIATVTPGAAATVPGRFAVITVDNSAAQVGIDQLVIAADAPPSNVLNVSAADLPFVIDAVVTPPTDATATFDVLLLITQLATATA